MRTLGVVLAGGQSRRFGSDKALAMLDGRTLLDRACAIVQRECDGVAVAGRNVPGVTAIADHPRPGMGPLGGLAGALAYARDHRFDRVLSIPVDAPRLPSDLLLRLAPAASHVATQPVIGLWPIEALDALGRILAGGGPHSLRALVEATGARAVQLGELPNINTPLDLAALDGGGA